GEPGSPIQIAGKLMVIVTMALVVNLAGAFIVMLGLPDPGRMMLLDPTAIMADPPVRVVPMAIVVVVTIARHIVGPTSAAERPLVLLPNVSSGGGMPGVEIVPVGVPDSLRFRARSSIGLHRQPTGQNQ